MDAASLFPLTLQTGAWQEDMEQKTSKRMLNLNAIKFKLTKLKSDKIRYEVIYKNLVRDVRKFYSRDFNDRTDFIKRKRKSGGEFFLQCLDAYIGERMGDLPKQLEVRREALAFNLGALIYPKEMLQLYAHDLPKKTQVLKIYNYLYKFSLEKLQKLINNSALVLLFARYIQINGNTRIEKSDNMGKYREAYLEACNIMLSESKHASKFTHLPGLAL